MPTKRMLCLAAAILPLAGCDGVAVEQPSGSVQAAMVTRVVDGDTIKVQVGGATERVRYIGIDTPETVKPNSPVECYGRAASDFNKRLVDGEAVTLTFDVEQRDRYGRLLAYVRRARDGLLVNDELVRRGYATTLTIPPNVRYAELFRAAQRSAREAGRGLWASCQR